MDESRTPFKMESRIADLSQRLKMLQAYVYIQMHDSRTPLMNVSRTAGVHLQMSHELHVSMLTTVNDALSVCVHTHI